MSVDVRFWRLQTSGSDVCRRQILTSTDIRIWCLQTSDSDVYRHQDLMSETSGSDVWRRQQILKTSDSDVYRHQDLMSEDVRFWRLQTSGSDVWDIRIWCLKTSTDSEDVRFWRLQTSESDVCRRQILTSTDIRIQKKRIELTKIFMMISGWKNPQRLTRTTLNYYCTSHGDQRVFSIWSNHKCLS